MARLPRFVLIGLPQHVIIWGNNREPIFYAEADASQGKHTIKWDGKDKNGIQQPDGYYTVLVSGKDASGNLVSVEHLVTGKVSGAGVDNGIVKLFVGNGLNIEQDKILSVRKPTPSLVDSSE